jgi:WD40 repeat protein
VRYDDDEFVTPTEYESCVFLTLLFTTSSSFQPQTNDHELLLRPCAATNTRFMMQEDDNRRPSRTLDPILTLQVAKDQTGPSVLGDGGSLASVSSLCFLSARSGNAPAPSAAAAANDDDADNSDNDSTSSSDDEDSEELQLRCRSLVQNERSHDQDITARAREAAASVSLSGYRLISCHTNGDSYIWDLPRRKIVQEFTPNRGPGLALRQMGPGADDDDDDDSNAPATTVLYHTRDSNGTVSLHDLEGTSHEDGRHLRTLVQFETHAQTFCAATPCRGNSNLLAMPLNEDSFATIRDVRVSPTSAPVALIHGAGMRDFSDPSLLRQHGMLTSLALSETGSTNAGRPILGCGMESGTLFFHDLAMLRGNQGKSAELRQKDPCGIKISKDPILALDMTPSALPETSRASGAVVVIAGMAGDAADLNDLATADQGTVAIVKATLQDETVQARLRAKLATCQIGNDVVKGKPGVSICRFRRDGRIFAVGGWDKRLRIFDRSTSATPLAILRGHEASVNSVDWAPDATTSGLLATGAADGRIYIWRCFSS